MQVNRRRCRWVGGGLHGRKSGNYRGKAAGEVDKRWVGAFVSFEKILLSHHSKFTRCDLKSYRLCSVDQ